MNDTTALQLRLIKALDRIKVLEDKELPKTDIPEDLWINAYLRNRLGQPSGL